MYKQTNNRYRTLLIYRKGYNERRERRKKIRCDEYREMMRNEYIEEEYDEYREIRHLKSRKVQKVQKEEK